MNAVADFVYYVLSGGLYYSIVRNSCSEQKDLNGITGQGRVAFYFSSIQIAKVTVRKI